MSVATPAPPVAPAGHRLVPALIGRPDNAQHAWIPCPEWCTQDHSTDRQVAIEDVWHSGDFVDLNMPHRDGSELLVYFRLSLDPYSSDEDKRRPFIFAEDGFTADGRHMDPAHVEEFCDKAIANLEKLRAVARGIAAPSEGVSLQHD